jgi:hypothetical protein
MAAGRVGEPHRSAKDHHEIRKLARTYGREAFLHLVKVMRGRSPKLAVMAAGLILDRAYGKPAQALTGADGEGPVRFEVSWREPKTPKGEGALVIDLKPDRPKAIEGTT